MTRSYHLVHAALQQSSMTQTSLEDAKHSGIPSLVLIRVRTLALLLSGDVINAPFSIYLNERYDNPHSQGAAALAFRLLHRFLVAHRIDLGARAMVGECLKSVECKWLTELAYRPVQELEQMSDRLLKRLTKVHRDSHARDLAGAVEPNTAAKRLQEIAVFLQWYLKLLQDFIRSAALRALCSDRYASSCEQLDEAIKETKQGHHHDIRSLPVPRYLQVIRTLVVEPELLFCNDDGRPSATMMRDRAMALLAAEGMRPGAIGNLTVDDFRYRAGSPQGHMEIKDNISRRGVPLTAATPTAKGIRSVKRDYNSNIVISLWPFTCIAIKEYLDGERTALLDRVLANPSKSFLFLAEHGGPIGDRSTITDAFNRLKLGLKANGLLNVAEGDPYSDGKHYEFSAYTLRHSAATMFYRTHIGRPDCLELMRERFGWADKSTSPSRYAKRAMSDAANVDMSEFHEELLQALADKRQQRQKQFTEPARGTED